MPVAGRAFGVGTPVHCAGKRYPEPVTTPLSLADCVLVLRPDDDVGVATRDLQSGTELDTLVVTQSVPRGHKLAVRAVAAGSPVHKYGQSIGRATRDIAVGDHVHSHNLGMDDDERAYEFGTARVSLPTPPGPERTFDAVSYTHLTLPTILLV